MVDHLHKDHVVCRPAQAKDTEPVMELCSHIWNGGDYIPFVWEEWMADPEGLLGVAELDGRVAGVFKLARFGECEWFMEGLRVHPDFQGTGVASHIHEYIVDTWRKMGSGVMRLVTHSENVKVHHMCERDGFRRIAEFIPYKVDPIEGESKQFRPLKNDEAQKAFDFLAGNPVHALSARLIDLGWVYGDPQLKHIQEAIEHGLACWWCDGEGFISFWRDEEDESILGIQLLACPIDNLADILKDARQLMPSIGGKTGVWVAPNQPEVITSLDQAGFERSWDKSLYVYELRDDGG